MTIFPVLGEFHKAETRYGADDLPRRFKLPGPSAEITGVVIRHGQIQFLQGHTFFPDQLRQKLGGMTNLEFFWIILPPHLVTGRASKEDLFGPFFTKRLKIMLLKGVKHILETGP